MANEIVNQLNEKLTEMLQSREAFVKHVDRDAMKEYISSLLVDQRNIQASLRELVSTGSKLKKALDVNQKDRNKPGVQAYFAYKGMLAKHPDKRAAAAEDENPLSALTNTVDINIQVLEELESTIDGIFTNKTINIFNTRLSHVVILGILAESKLIYNYSRYLISGMVSSLTKQRDIAKYRYAFINDNGQQMANIVARAHSKTGSYNFQAMIKDLKTQSIDVTLIDDMANVVPNNIDESKIKKNTLNVMQLGIPNLNIFRWLGEIWVTMKHNRAQEAKREKEWMEAHVALLKMDLADMDPDSEEYKRLVKIIEKYEEMITKADRKLNEQESK